MLCRWCCVDDGAFEDVVWMVMCKWCCVDGAPSAVPATQNETEVLQVPDAAPAVQKQGTPSAAPATQNQPEFLQVLHLPRKTSQRPK